MNHTKLDWTCQTRPPKKHVKMHLKRASFFKFGLISEFFSLSLEYPKKGAKNYTDYYPPKEKMLRIVI